MSKVAGYRPPSMIETIRMDLGVLEIAANAGDLPTARRSADAAERMFIGLRAALCGRGLDVGPGPSWSAPAAPAPAPAPAAAAPAPAPAPAAAAPAPRPTKLSWAVAAEAWSWPLLARLCWMTLCCSCALLWRFAGRCWS